MELLSVEGAVAAWKEQSKQKETFAARFVPEDISVITVCFFFVGYVVFLLLRLAGHDSESENDARAAV